MRRWIFLSFLWLPVLVQAQYYSLGVNSGASFFRGETTAEGQLLSEPGIHLAAVYNKWIPLDERWQISGILDINAMNSRIKTGEGSLPELQAYSFILSPMVGIRYYFDRDLKDYVPEKYQDAFFLALYAGISMNKNQYQIPNEFTTENPYYSSDWGLSFSNMIQGGYRIFLNSHWSVEAQASLKYGTSDNWDAFNGTTNLKDWIFTTGLGLSYAFDFWR
ncbi:DUF3575 domain-containing protein [Croceimicrobium hydrocarbonivorans]|uniref:DUF3575 domain-containing protein n=1 Tax=Croceimicrobium hydrocarbonivorans TaxID=2761580 RepID=A0A7H0VDI7_9FLAO|nr:DUF3575 domain-containing protein [Croceimicrobium hydrocarbonivorans]QNR23785.1 DUF3575 domain-containing protein [Croceimicrobium hydrocarbonivorans]